MLSLYSLPPKRFFLTPIYIPPLPAHEWKNGRAMEQHGAAMQGMEGMEGQLPLGLSLSHTRSISLFRPRPCSPLLLPWPLGYEKKKKVLIKNYKNYSTEYSHVVPHHSTDSAIDCLTTQIGRDAVLLVVYGRNSLFGRNRTIICRRTVET